MTSLVASLIALGAGLVIALAFVALGAVRLVRLNEKFKERLERYRTLTVLRYLDEANVKIARASGRIDAAPALLYRANSAIASLTAARARAVAIATSPSALWRLGELVVTGR